MNRQRFIILLVAALLAVGANLASNVRVADAQGGRLPICRTCQ